MNESGSPPQVQEVPVENTPNDGKVDFEDMKAKYSHVFQGNSGISKDFDLSEESEDEKAAELSRRKFEEGQILKARDEEEMRRRENVTCLLSLDCGP